ncbi:MAG: hypothetical protein H6695_11210 [Deferribacteres bacterium]|nr:hypothetical protein [Deferribacteres bacterium]
MEREIRFESLLRSRQQLSFTYMFDSLRFETAYWYSDVDLFALEARLGERYMQSIYFHIMAFEANKLLSLCPHTVDFGPLAPYATAPFRRLWLQVAHSVWAQWRYENDLPFYQGPVLRAMPAPAAAAPVANVPGSVETLAFCGGGKDSLVAMKLLEKVDIPYATFVYSSSIYGTASHQHQLVDRLLQHCQPAKTHRKYIFDSFVDAPVLELYPEFGSRSITAAETPASIFGVLPVVLQHGYRYIALAHERSANTGNLMWDVTDEDVNHQWGKSFAAEQLLNSYIQTELISNFSYFSLLQPIYDVVIFNMLRGEDEAVKATHSCNIRKPWCGRCPKCAYVWLNYMAYLPTKLVDDIFGENLFDLPENTESFRQMLGLAKHTPFECIGQIPEAQLAFEICKRKGLTGEAMTLYQQHFLTLETAEILDRYLQVDAQASGIPQHYFDRILPELEVQATKARVAIDRLLDRADA